MDRKQVDFGREKEVFPLVLIQVKSAAKRTVFDLKNKREKTFLPFKTQLFHIQVVRYAASENLNAVFINQSIPQGERLVKLNQIAIQQMKILEGDGKRKLLK